MESLLGSPIISRLVGFSGVPQDGEKSKCQVKASNGVQQQPAQSSSSLPLLRSSFPGPLKFLWFSKQGEERVEAADPFSVAAEQPQAEITQEESVNETVVDDDTKPSSSWALSNWGLRSFWSSQPADPGSSHAEEEEDKESATSPEVCRECELHDTQQGCCVVDSAAEESSPVSVEIPHIPIPHDRESFSRFLHPLSLAESKSTARLSHLCNLAYKIQDIKPSDLLMHHHLTLVTSSLEKKKLALKESDGNTGASSSEAKQRFSVSPASAYALAAAVASYLHSHAKSLLRLKQQQQQQQQHNEALEKQDSEDCDPDHQSSSYSASPGRVIVPANPEADYESSEMASLIASSPMTAVVAAKDGTKDAVAKDLQSLHNCPCEWYCCDDNQHFTRYFVIQGSESLASWQANLLFEPTHFEDNSLGVMVHRGIYEAAKGLYEQLLPSVVEHLQEHGEKARFCFTGHSLGGSLGALVSLMLRIRGVVTSPGALLPVLTFGSPCIMCGGDYLLEKLGLAPDHIRAVILHRDIVPRTFACSYPDHVAEILKRLNGSFRDHPCLNNQRLLYAPMGQFIVLQPTETDAPPHPLLPPGLGLYAMRHPEEEAGVDPSSSSKVELRAAQRAFLNCPHPLETLSDPGSYGSEGSISRGHDPKSYTKSLGKYVREEAKKNRKLRRQQRRGLWWPLMTAELSSMFSEADGAAGEIREAAAASGGKEVLLFRKAKKNRSYGEQIAGAHRQSQVLVLFFLSAKVLVMQGFATFFAWA